jgi:NAD(P) transhydrogenase subunit alpha
MVRGMRRGSVILDMAAEAGGNCALTEADRTVEKHGVTIMGPVDLASSVPAHGTQMYGKILSAVLDHVLEDGAVVIDLENDITSSCVVTHDGKVRYQS